MGLLFLIKKKEMSGEGKKRTESIKINLLGIERKREQRETA